MVAYSSKPANKSPFNKDNLAAAKAMMSKNKFTNTMTEAFSENETFKYATVFLILVLITLIAYCMLNNKNV